MDTLLDFFANTMIITGGIISIVLWLIAIVLGIIEVSDRVREGKSTTLEED